MEDHEHCMVCGKPVPRIKSYLAPSCAEHKRRVQLTTFGMIITMLTLATLAAAQGAFHIF